MGIFRDPWKKIDRLRKNRRTSGNLDLVGIFRDPREKIDRLRKNRPREEISIPWRFTVLCADFLGPVRFSSAHRGRPRPLRIYAVDIGHLHPLRKSSPQAGRPRTFDVAQDYVDPNLSIFHASAQIPGGPI